MNISKKVRENLIIAAVFGVIGALFFGLLGPSMGLHAGENSAFGDRVTLALFGAVVGAVIGILINRLPLPGR
jgi:uncharacterized membrane protein YeaQ/YmgE (transglycosylase-associated protein family)